MPDTTIKITEKAVATVPRDDLHVLITQTENGVVSLRRIARDVFFTGLYAAAGSIALSAAWSGSGPYTQSVTVTGAAVTAASKVDLQLTAAQLAALLTAGVTALVVENNAGTLTAYALGAAPSAAMTVQCTVTEVTV